jgi:hypothetical protein
VQLPRGEVPGATLDTEEARRCHSCGYHHQRQPGLDRCEQCGDTLDTP